MKIVPSLLIDTMHGSFSGSVIRRSRWGLIGQKKANPARRGNPNQSLSRSRFQAIATSWRAVSNSDKSEWNNIASTNPIYTKDNGLLNVTGFNFYNYVAQNLALIGRPMISPATYDNFVPALVDLELTTTTSTILTARVKNTGDPTNSLLYGGLVILPYENAPIFNNGLLYASTATAIIDTYPIQFSGLDSGLVSQKRYAFIGKVIYYDGGISPWLFIRQL